MSVFDSVNAWVDLKVSKVRIGGFQDAKAQLDGTNAPRTSTLCGPRVLNNTASKVSEQMTCEWFEKDISRFFVMDTKSNVIIPVSMTPTGV